MEHMMFMDTSQYLPDDILVKVDRAAMYVSLETRVPILDPTSRRRRLGHPARGALPRWPGQMAVAPGLARYVPVEMFDRPKGGFSIPLAHWLRGELKDWAAAVARLRRDCVARGSSSRR